MIVEANLSFFTSDAANLKLAEKGDDVDTTSLGDSGVLVDAIALPGAARGNRHVVGFTPKKVATGGLVGADSPSLGFSDHRVRPDGGTAAAGADRVALGFKRVKVRAGLGGIETLGLTAPWAAELG